jgi:mRNA-degrading endonuclease HigB of HigAB toxin-antitoxin module
LVPKGQANRPLPPESQDSGGYRVSSRADRIVFNIKGNDYRLVVAVDFEKGIVWIKWIGTHKDYDKIDVNEVKHER